MFEMNNIRYLVGAILFTMAIASGCNGQHFPTSVKMCKHEDKQCIADVINGLTKTASNSDIPELGLKKLNPYPLFKVNIEHGAGSAVELKITLRNASIEGLDCVVIDRVNGFDEDPRKSQFLLNGHCKHLSMTGRYKVTGKLLLFPISGQGYCNMSFTNTNFTTNWVTEVQTKNNEDYLKIKHVEYKSTIERFHMNLENLFNNKELSDNMNAILNENSHLILKDVQPSIENVISKVVREISQPVFDKFPYKNLFLE